uniref:Uncharacterized protein n=1 Tax=Peronospora matthiolae TaxID=2874970 RepID=A0AAV1TPE0_9STRA
MRLHFLLFLLSLSTGVFPSVPSITDPVRASAGFLLVVNHATGEIEGRQRHLREEPETQARGLNGIAYKIPGMVNRMRRGPNFFDLESLHIKKVKPDELYIWLITNRFNRKLARVYRYYAKIKKEVNADVDKRIDWWGLKRLASS